VYVDALVRFVVEIPITTGEADTHADELSDAIAYAVGQIGHGVYKDSATVIDWTQREESEVLTGGYPE